MSIIPALDEKQSKPVLERFDKVLAKLEEKKMLSPEANKFLQEFIKDQNHVRSKTVNAYIPELVESLEKRSSRSNLDPKLVRSKIDALTKESDAENYGGRVFSQKINSFLESAKSNVKGAGLVKLPEAPNV